jgi:hypothetical protein
VDAPAFPSAMTSPSPVLSRVLPLGLLALAMPCAGRRAAEPHWPPCPETYTDLSPRSSRPGEKHLEQNRYKDGGPGPPVSRPACRLDNGSLFVR